MTPNNIILGIIILVLLGFTVRYEFLLRVSKNHIRELQSELIHLQLENLFSSESGFEKMAKQAKKDGLTLHHSSETDQWTTEEAPHDNR